MKKNLLLIFVIIAIVALLVYKKEEKILPYYEQLYVGVANFLKLPADANFQKKMSFIQLAENSNSAICLQKILTDQLIMS